MPPPNLAESAPKPVFPFCVTRLSHSESIDLDRPHPPAPPWSLTAGLDGRRRCSSVASHCIYIPSDFHTARFSSCSWPVGAGAVGAERPQASDPVAWADVQSSRGNINVSSALVNQCWQFRSHGQSSKPGVDVSPRGYSGRRWNEASSALSPADYCGSFRNKSAAEVVARRGGA